MEALRAAPGGPLAAAAGAEYSNRSKAYNAAREELVDAQAMGPWRRVAASMALGAVYDLAFGVVILFFPARGADWLGLQLPPDLVFLRLNGVFLLLLAGLYTLSALDPRRYAGVVLVAAAGRFLGFLYLAGAWLAGLPPAFLALAFCDLFFALLHAILLGLTRRPNRAK